MLLFLVFFFFLLYIDLCRTTWFILTRNHSRTSTSLFILNSILNMCKWSYRESRIASNTNTKRKHTIVQSCIVHRAYGIRHEAWIAHLNIKYCIRKIHSLILINGFIPAFRSNSSAAETGNKKWKNKNEYRNSIGIKYIQYGIRSTSVKEISLIINGYRISI